MQVCFEWNTAVHAADCEGRPGRRALTKGGLQRLFDHADDRVAAAHDSGRKGWLAAMRDSVALKVGYAWGLRRRELAMLELSDFGTHQPRLRPPSGRRARYGLTVLRW
jgi:integrase